jgi:hypothetical protein
MEIIEESLDKNQLTIKESQLRDYILKLIKKQSKDYTVKIIDNLLKEQSKLCPEIIGAFCPITSNGKQKFATIPMRCSEIQQGDLVLAIKVTPQLFNLPPQFSRGYSFLINDEGLISQTSKDYYLNKEEIQTKQKEMFKFY